MKVIKKFAISFSICTCLSISVYADENNDSNKAGNQNKFVLGVYGGGSLMQMSSEYYSTSRPYDDLPGDYDKSLFGVSYGAKIGYDMYFLARHGVKLYIDYMHYI